MNIFCLPFIFDYCQQVLFTLRVSSLISQLNDAFVDIFEDDDFFHFSQESKFTSPLCIYIILATDTEAESRASHNCYSVKNMLTLIAFKWLINELLLAREWSEVIIIWWIVSIKFIRLFKKFSLLNLYSNDSPWNFNYIVKSKCKMPFSQLLKGYIFYIFLIWAIQC